MSVLVHSIGKQIFDDRFNPNHKTKPPERSSESFLKDALEQLIVNIKQFSVFRQIKLGIEGMGSQSFRQLHRDKLLSTSEDFSAIAGSLMKLHAGPQLFIFFVSN